MIYLGDFPADQAIYFAWNTNDGDGASITRSGDGVISVYKDASNGTAFDTTQVTTGVTNDEDFDALVGVHTCCIVTTNAWYETGHDYIVVLSASTIDTQSVSAVIAHFSIENRNMRGTDSAATATALTTHDGKLDTVDANVDAILIDTAAIDTLTKGGGSGDLAAIKTQVDAVLDLTRDGGSISVTSAETTIFEDAAPTKNKVGVVVKLDMAAAASGDTFVVKEKYKDESGGAYQLVDTTTYTGAQTRVLKIINLTPYRYGAIITMQKTAGVDRSIEWESFVEE